MSSELDLPIKSFKELRKEVISIDEAQERLLAMQSANDYEAAIVSASLVENLLSQVISTRFIELGSDRLEGIFGSAGSAPLATFSAKIKIAYALGMLGDKTRQQFERVNTIRNHFAHHRNKVSFQDGSVSKECLNFRNQRISLDEDVVTIEGTNKPQMKYVLTCIHLAIGCIVHLESDPKEPKSPVIPINTF